MTLITETGEIKMGARAAWHWAFDPAVNSVDMRDVFNTLGVQFSARGPDSFMSRIEKGWIQQAVHALKIKKPEAWAWGMLAYAPDGTENISLLRNILITHVFEIVRTAKFNPFMSSEAGKLVFIAMIDAAIEARRDDGKRCMRKRADMTALLRCTADAYKRDWAPKLYAMKDALKDLDAIALPPIFDVIALMADKAFGNNEAVEDFKFAMRTEAFY